MKIEYITKPIRVAINIYKAIYLHRDSYKLGHV